MSLSEKNSCKKWIKRWIHLFKARITEFCLETCLHGYRQVVDTHRSRWDRISWGISVLISFILAVVFMQIAWEYNSSRPTITVIESTHRGIWNYPFPAVTICNINRISLEKTKKLVQNLKIPSDLSQEYLINEFPLLLELLEPGIYGIDIKKNLSQLQEIIDNNGLTISQVIKMITQDCSSLITSCKWKGIWTGCMQLFEQTMSRDGLCCSFNYITREKSAINRLPKRVTACGYQTGLTLLLNIEPDDYLASLRGAYGVKIILHYSYDYPDRNAESKLLGMGYQIFLSVTPEETYSTPDIKKLAIKSRNCLFSDEGSMSRKGKPELGMKFDRYSYLNCITNCRALIIEEKCHCIPYYYSQNSSRLCTLRDVECLREFKNWFETSLPGIDVSKSGALSSGGFDNDGGPCQCLADCTLYRYPVEGSQGILDVTNPHDIDDSFKKMNTQQESMVHIFFSDLVAIQYRRSVYYDWRNLFASFGGLMGLFAGFSLMSGFELLYFFIIRPICGIRFQINSRH